MSTKEQGKRTAGPWHVMPDGFTSKPGSPWRAPTVYATDDELRYIAVCACPDFGNIGEATDNLANAEFIVRAVNAHDDMLAACKAAKDLFAYGVGAVSISEYTKDNSDRCINEAKKLIAQFEAAIAKAEGR